MQCEDALRRSSRAKGIEKFKICRYPKLYVHWPSKAKGSMWVDGSWLCSSRVRCGGAAIYQVQRWTEDATIDRGLRSNNSLVEGPLGIWETSTLRRRSHCAGASSCSNHIANLMIIINSQIVTRPSTRGCSWREYVTPSVDLGSLSWQPFQAPNASSNLRWSLPWPWD
jgi:hypothetical protein